jgi:hypothetical protein
LEDKGGLLFFTYADLKYDFFAVPYAYFALRNNPGAYVEICLENLDSFYSRQKPAVDMLERIFPGRALFRQAESIKKNKAIVPNTVRFVEVPITKCEYLYIGDIDLLVFDDVLQIHLGLIAENSLPFSNILRREQANSSAPRLSGLHFCKHEDYYPLPDLQDMDLSVENDENVLYEIMRRKGLMVPLDFQTRPECGIHMSLNRDPLGRSTGPATLNYSINKTHGWGGRHYYPRLLEQIAEENLCVLLPRLDFEFRILLLAAEALATDQMRKLHRAACAYFVDKRMLVTASDMSFKTVIDERSGSIREKDFRHAESLGVMSALVWPRNIEVWFKQAWLWFTVGNAERATEALMHITELPGGIDYLGQAGLVDEKMEQIRLTQVGPVLLRRLNK